MNLDEITKRYEIEKTRADKGGAVVKTIWRAFLL